MSVTPQNALIPPAEIIAVLQDLISSSSAIEAAAVVARDGRIVARATRRDAEADALHAAIAELLAPDSTAMRQVALGTLGQVVLSAAARRVMIRQSGPNALICTLTGGHGRGGSQMPSISGAAAKLADMVPEPPAEPRPVFGTKLVPAATAVPECPLSADELSRIVALRPYVIGILPSVTDKVYNAIEAEPQMAKFMANGTARLRQMHLVWLESLFSGEYGPAFVQRQQDIGRAHSLAGIPPVLFAANMAYLRAIFPTALRTCLGEGVLAENAIGTVMRLVDFAHDLIDTTSAGLIARLGTPRRV
ncbi:protoglobin domain-containing protein [Acidocella aromatica]|uniref:Putative regulator of Ras-like GTPase activity (Roadblock/LC7/MglB family) n=1 Tax=Acidocella aromatica TaxID=1303579 RepID=A0A840VC84_9PROT|nr:protoglobin domain-containing protein [Acidocella aromatica]MBB5373508.1 putative regulator of Ras-like GTPase activity (Roadblock/LC7/MglB family) [Acidocella aromatica]